LLEAALKTYRFSALVKNEREPAPGKGRLID